MNESTDVYLDMAKILRDASARTLALIDSWRVAPTEPEPVQVMDD